MKKSLVILCFILIFLINLVSATDYYISSSPTTSTWIECTRPSGPYCSLSMANSNAQPGDSIYLMQGTYELIINPSNSGTSTNPIIWKNYNGETVLIAQSTGSSVILNENYHIIEGLSLMPSNPAVATIYIVHITGNNNIVKDCSIIYNGDTVARREEKIKFSGIVIEGGDDNLVQGNTIRNLSNHGITCSDSGNNVAYRNKIINNTVTGQYGNSVSVQSTQETISGTLIEGNSLGESIVSDGVQSNGDYTWDNTKNWGIIVRDNVIYGNAENNVDLKGTKYFVIEGNILYGSLGDNNGPQDCHSACNGNLDRNGGIGGITRGSGQGSEDIIVRKNTIYDNKGGISAIKGKFYSNTLLNNNKDYTQSNSEYTGTCHSPSFFFNNDNHQERQFYGIFTYSSTIKNNFIGTHNHGEIIATNSVMDYNAYYFSPSSNDYYKLLVNNYNSNLQAPCDYNIDIPGYPYFVDINGDGYFQQDDYVFSAWQTNMNKDENSFITTNPGFVNAGPRPTGNHEQYNFHLTSDSDLIDRGIHLTVTTGSGSGTSLNVEDAGYFFDGYGVTQGDLIKVGSNSPVRITTVDYTNDRITLENSISWNNNDPVYYCQDSNCFEGSAPDIGAFEYTSQTQTCTSEGYQCCNLCQSGTEQSQYDGDCSSQVCCSTCQTQSKSYTIKKTNSPPTINGNLNEFNNANEISINNSRGNKIDYKMLWDSNNLYIAVQGTDSELAALINTRDANGIWNDDSVEVFFDTLNDKTSSMNSDDYKFFVNLLNAQYDYFNGGGGDLWNTVFSSDVTISGTLNSPEDTDSGFTIEIAIPFTDWVIPSENDVWGFDVNFNDRNNAGIREWKAWNQVSGLNMPNEFGEIVFSSEIVLNCGNADSDSNGEVVLSELLSYIALWKSGNVSINELLVGIEEWKNGC